MWYVFILVTKLLGSKEGMNSFDVLTQKLDGKLQIKVLFTLPRLVSLKTYWILIQSLTSKQKETFIREFDYLYQISSLHCLQYPNLDSIFNSFRKFFFNTLFFFSKRKYHSRRFMIYTITHSQSFQGVSFYEKYWRSLCIVYFVHYGVFLWHNMDKPMFSLKN